HPEPAEQRGPAAGPQPPVSCRGRMTHADRAVSTARWQSVGWVARHPPLGARPSRCAPSGASSWQRHTFVTLAASRTPWLWDVSKGWLTGFEPAISRSTIGPDGPSEQTPNPYA